MPATALEQMILELVNRARLDPAAEAARDGIDLNEGVPANETISADSKQPLAMNETLLGVARAHSQDMIDRDYFAHNTPEGVTPFQRITTAGYSYTTAGENIAYQSTTGTLSNQMTIDLHQLLFVDSGIADRGHRTNILFGAYQEIGVGQVTGNYQGSDATMLTEDFGTRGSQQFLTGVSYADADHNNFYSLGEGRGSMSVMTAGGQSTSTGAAGGYSLAVGSGLQTIAFSGGGLASPISVAVFVAANTNAKVDVIDQGVIETSASLTDLGGATKIIGLGTFGLTLTGDGGNDTIVGTKGNDTIDGAGGTDTVVFTGNFSVYTLTDLGNGSLRVAGADGTDILKNVELLQFSDQTIHTTGTGPGAVSAPLHDFNGDGSSDLLWRQGGGTFSEWQSTGSGFTPNVTVDSSVNNAWHSEGAFDFSGDGRADLLWRNDASGAFTIWDSTGNGFTQNSFGDGSVNTSWKVAALADFNGDGMSDILWRNTNGTFTEWQSTGTGFTANVYGNGTVDNSWHLVAAADFSGDGKADLLWRNDNGAFTEWQSTGNAFTPNVYGNGSVDPTWHIMGTGDFNGDGKADILFRNNNGTFTEWQSTGNGFTANVYGNGTVDNSWHLAQVGDFNGDGKSDLLWRNDNGTFTEWQSTGNGFTPNVYGNGSVGTDWTLVTHHYDLV